MPAPTARHERVDAHGNGVTELTFDRATGRLVVHSRCVAQVQAALAAAFDPAGAAPIEGSYSGDAHSTLSTALTIDVQR